MLALEGWGKNLALLSRRLLMVILQRAKGFQRDCECGLVDEECSHSHTKKYPVSASRPHAWPIIPAAERNWTGPHHRSLSALVTT